VTVLVIRKNRRFAVRRSATLRVSIGAAQALLHRGLLVELSLDGCRLSSFDPAAFSLEQLVSLEIEGFDEVDCRVRWAKDGFVGLRFLQPLHVPMLDRMIRGCRSEGELRSYGT
jgi:hypothetical protein